MVDVVDMKLNDVVKLIRGQQGTIVRLEVIPGDGTERKIIKITREQIELKDSEAQGEVFEAGRKPDGKPYRVGVIDLPSFYMDMEGARRGDADFKSTTRDVRASSTISTPRRRRRGSRPASQRRRIADRGHQPDRAVHRRRAGRAGQGCRRPRARLYRPDPGIAWRGRWSC